jgi:ubiquinone/menaquinone biosynthesis C-methylase UbiE
MGGIASGSGPGAVAPFGVAGGVASAGGCSGIVGSLIGPTARYVPSPQRIWRIRDDLDVLELHHSVARGAHASPEDTFVARAPSYRLAPEPSLGGNVRAVASTTSTAQDFVPESKFGIWFLGTDVWRLRVLRRALDDLERLMSPRKASYPAILDIGFGHGVSLVELAQRFAPKRLVGVDADPDAMDRSREAVRACPVEPELYLRSASDTQLESDSFDMVFCHQTFHHLVDQEGAIAEFFRVLRPGGILLFAESTRRYIHSWVIRTLFRHPMDVQKTAEEYIALVRSAGFDVPEDRISYPYLWWSRYDLAGAREMLRLHRPERREETLVNLVAIKRPTRA